MKKIVKAKDIIFDKDLFVNYLSGTVLDLLLCSYRGLPKGVNYMVIGDPGVGKTTIILDLMANIHRIQPNNNKKTYNAYDTKRTIETSRFRRASSVLEGTRAGSS